VSDETTKVNCPICGKSLALDFFECDECGCRNPQLQLVKRHVMRISFAPEVASALVRVGIESGKSTDAIVNQAVEAYITAYMERRIKRNWKGGKK
jgi:hypothetical protein